MSHSGNNKERYSYAHVRAAAIIRDVGSVLRFAHFIRRSGRKRLICSVGPLV
jgi:hypothetical protein